jgi:NTE family protein
MLVDGGVVDNVPTRVMASLKSGPNLVVDVRPLTHRFFEVSYDAIPGRATLLWRLASPWTRKASLPRCPGPVSVVQRSVFGNIRDDAAPVDPLQLTFRLPPFSGSSFMNWDRHAEVLDAAYEWAKRTIDELLAADNQALSTMLAYSKAC